MAHGLAARPELQLDPAAISCDREPCRQKLGGAADEPRATSREARLSSTHTRGAGADTRALSRSRMAQRTLPARVVQPLGGLSLRWSSRREKARPSAAARRSASRFKPAQSSTASLKL